MYAALLLYPYLSWLMASHCKELEINMTALRIMDSFGNGNGYDEEASSTGSTGVC
jgi:hypothetical protein